MENIRKSASTSDPNSPSPGHSGHSGHQRATTSQRMACNLCRKRKLRCDKGLPMCGSCARLGHECIYGMNRGGRASRSRVQPQTLATRLAQIEGYLERQSHLRPSPPQATFDVNTLTEDDMNKLDDRYFELVSFHLSIIHQKRYEAAARPRSESQIPKYLQSAMWALASRSFPEYAHASTTFYHIARQELQSAEMTDETRDNIAVSQVQAWVLLAAYETGSMHLHRAWMSVGRATRLSLLLRLHRLDLDDHDPILDDDEDEFTPQDWTEKEEWKATFWAAYITDRYCSLGFGLPPSLDDREIRTSLPAPEEKFLASTEVPTVTLSQAMAGERTNLLSVRGAAAVLLTLGFRRLASLKQWSADRLSRGGQSLWEDSSWIESMLTTKFSPLPHLGLDLSENVQNDPRAIFYNILTNCMTICVLQTASLVATQGNVSSESQTQCLKLQYDAAGMIAAILRSEVDGKGVSITNSFLLFCLYAAASVFAKSLARSPDRSTEESLKLVLIHLVRQRGKYRLSSGFLDDLQQSHPDLEAALKILKLEDGSESGSQTLSPKAAMEVNESSGMSPGSQSQTSGPSEAATGQSFSFASDQLPTHITPDAESELLQGNAPRYDPSWSSFNWNTFPDFMDSFTGDNMNYSANYWNFNPNDVSFTQPEDYKSTNYS